MVKPICYYPSWASPLRRGIQKYPRRLESAGVFTCLVSLAYTIVQVSTFGAVTAEPRNASAFNSGVSFCLCG